jgi:5'(3')-deoxyribonucleotidase
MKKQTIAVDVDDVLAASAKGWIEYSNKHWGHTLTTEDYIEDWFTMWDVDDEEGRRRASELNAKAIVQNFEHFADAIAVLRKLAQKYRLVITTARVEQNRPHTLAWIDRYFGDIFEEIHLAGFFDQGHLNPLIMTKADMQRAVGADYMIDDQPKHCLAAAEAGIQAILFGDYGWNRDIGALPERVTRCKDWAAVQEYFDGAR